MDTMTDETYNGYANRETWAFNLHWQNDQGLYNETLEVAREVMDDATDWQLGNAIVEHWEDIFDGYEDGTPMPATLRMFRNEVGSFWRVDRKEVGAAVRESLDIESGD